MILPYLWSASLFFFFIAAYPTTATISTRTTSSQYQGNGDDSTGSLLTDPFHHKNNLRRQTTQIDPLSSPTSSTKRTLAATTPFPTNMNMMTTLPTSFKCDLCQTNYTFIMATGRSGSTTLLDMINQLDRYDIGGEHDGQFNALFEMYKAFETAKQFSKFVTNGGSWANREIPKRDLFCWIQSWYQLTSGMKPNYHPLDVHGFKEIRYNTTEVLDFISQVFPCGKFILNMRNDVEAQHQSTFKRKTPLNELQHHNEVLLKFAKDHPKQTHFMILEDFQDLNKWNDLFIWLDRPHCKATGVLDSHGNHSFVVDKRKVVVCSYN